MRGNAGRNKDVGLRERNFRSTRVCARLPRSGCDGPHCSSWAHWMDFPQTPSISKSKSRHFWCCHLRLESVVSASIDRWGQGKGASETAMRAARVPYFGSWCSLNSQQSGEAFRPAYQHLISIDQPKGKLNHYGNAEDCDNGHGQNKVCRVRSLQGRDGGHRNDFKRALGFCA